jgi:thioredoxin-like negative regulator of GroEL
VDIDWLTDLEAAQAAARAARRPLFIDFWDYHCNGCEALEAETYPDPEVARLLREHFVVAKINTTDQPDLARQYGVFWTPTLVPLHHLGHRLRETIGFLPPEELRAELTLARGLYALRSARAAEAETLFQEVAEVFTDSHAAPEAMYWQGLAAYRRSKNKEDLWQIWRELVEAYPASIWARKTTLLPATSAHPAPAARDLPAAAR